MAWTVIGVNRKRGKQRQEENLETLAFSNVFNLMTIIYQKDMYRNPWGKRASKFVSTEINLKGRPVWSHTDVYAHAQSARSRWWASLVLFPKWSVPHPHPSLGYAVTTRRNWARASAAQRGKVDLMNCSSHSTHSHFCSVPANASWWSGNILLPCEALGFGSTSLKPYPQTWAISTGKDQKEIKESKDSVKMGEERRWGKCRPVPFQTGYCLLFIPVFMTFTSVLRMEEQVCCFAWVRNLQIGAQLTVSAVGGRWFSWKFILLERLPRKVSRPMSFPHLTTNGISDTSELGLQKALGTNSWKSFLLERGWSKPCPLYSLQNTDNLRGEVSNL